MSAKMKPAIAIKQIAGEILSGVFVVLGNHFITYLPRRT